MVHDLVSGSMGMLRNGVRRDTDQNQTLGDESIHGI